MSDVCLRHFGSIFMGPLLTFISEKVKHGSNGEPVYFLAREGYWLQQAFERFTNGEAPSHYLLASRSFMFKLLLDNPSSYSLALKGEFEGSFYELMRSRFMLSDSDIRSTFSKMECSAQITLPGPFYDEVVELLESKQEVLHKLLKPTQEAYRAYLHSIGLTECEMLHLVDLGYSGTIQKLLGLFLNKETVGHYLIASQPGKQEFAGQPVEMKGYLKEGVKLSDGYKVLDRSMFLESLLTSPNGQFQDVRKSCLPNQSFEFYYGRKVAAQAHFHDLRAIMESALEFVSQAAEHGMTFSTDEVEALLEQYLSRRGMFPTALHHLFSIDDDVAGNGTVDALQFFGLK